MNHIKTTMKIASLHPSVGGIVGQVEFLCPVCNSKVKAANLDNGIGPIGGFPQDRGYTCDGENQSFYRTNN